jgi:hypothetical protein
MSTLRSCAFARGSGITPGWTAIRRRIPWRTADAGRSDEVVFVCERGGSGPRSDIELAEDVADVPCDSVLADD